MAERIGFLGLGMMGSGMAASLMRAGHPLVLWPGRSAAAVKTLVARGAETAATRADLVVNCDVLVTCLPDSPTVADLADEILPVLRPGQLWIDATTADPSETVRIAQEVDARGARFADSPVTGGPPQAAEGALASMVGCAEADWLRVKAIAGGWSGKVQRFGDIGSGHSAKLLNNLVTQTTGALLAETFAMARQKGVNWQALYDVMMSGAARSGTLEKMVGLALQGNYDGMSFSIRNAEKDLRYASAMFEDAGRPSEFAPVARDRLARAVEQGFGDAFVSRMLDPDSAGKDPA